MKYRSRYALAENEQTAGKKTWPDTRYRLPLCLPATQFSGATMTPLHAEVHVRKPMSNTVWSDII